MITERSLSSTRLLQALAKLRDADIVTMREEIKKGGERRLTWCKVILFAVPIKVFR